MSLASRPAAAPAAVPVPAPAAGWSLRSRMVGVGLLVTVLAWTVGGVVTVGAAGQINARMRDARLVQLAETVAAFAEHELAEIELDRRNGAQLGEVHVEQRGALDLRYRYQIWQREPRLHLVLHSPDASPSVPLAPGHVPGFADVVGAGDRLRTYVHLSGAGKLEIQVAEVLDSEVSALALPGVEVLAAMLVSLVGVLGLAGWMVVRALEPVARAERLLRERSLQDLAPVPHQGAPREMQPLLAALNHVLERAAEKLSRERGFTALAAHELRTPLAALRMQAQVALREADPASRAQQLRALVTSVDRCDHLIEQLLTLARIEQGEAAGGAGPVDLAAVCRQVREELGVVLQRSGVELELALQETHLHGRAFALQTLLRNLVANALAHAPAGSAVRISSRRVGSAVELCVDDAGPGIAVADRARVFERFVRLERSAPTAGVGLGLAIVRAVTDDHGGRVELRDSVLGGLCVRISLPDGADPAGSHARAP